MRWWIWLILALAAIQFIMNWELMKLMFELYLSGLLAWWS